MNNLILSYASILSLLLFFALPVKAKALLTDPPVDRWVAPGNDFCAGAIPITPSPAGASCTVAGFTLPFSTDGTTESGVINSCDNETETDQWFTWTATTDGLNFASDLDNSSGIAVFASCDDANAGQAIDCLGPLGSGVLSGWNVGDELLIQIFDSKRFSSNDITFCLEAITVVISDTPPVNDLCAGAIPIQPSPEGTGCDTPVFLLPFASDGTTDSGVPTANFIEPFNDQWFTWTATSEVLEFTTASPGLPGITVFANCADANAGNEIVDVSPLSNGELSGWNIGDELIIQIYGLRGTPNSDVAFCLEDPNATDEPPVARCRNQGVRSISSSAVSCNVTITVTDPGLACDDAPIARCANDFTVELDEFGSSAAFIAEELNAGSSDTETPAADLLFSFDPTEGPLDCDDIGTQSVSLIVTDNVGKTDTCFTQVTVEDNLAPEVTCQNVVIELEADQSTTLSSGLIAFVIATDFSDNCAASPPAVTNTQTRRIECDELGVATRTFIYLDGNGQEGRCPNVRLQVNDPLGVYGEDPVANCSETTVIVDNLEDGPAVVNANVFDNGSTDDRSVYTLVYSDATDRQENTTFDCSTTGVNQGQTFTAGQTGVIQSIKVRAGAASSNRLLIRDFFSPGDSVSFGGYFQDVDLFFGEYSDRANLTVINLDVPFPVTAGQQYFFRLIGETTLSRSCSGSDAYADGRPTQGDNFLNSSGDEDLTFEVNIIGPTEQAFPTVGATPVTVYAVDDQGNVSPGCLTFVNPDQPLPVSWLSFGAAAGTKQVDLQWETTEEPNNAGFHVERSATGNNWSAIGEVDARPGSDQRYDFADNAPLSGTSYYRLRQTDFDGRVTYSPVETVDFFGEGQIFLYPNPATSILNVRLPEGAVLLGLTDLTGRSVNVHFEGQAGQLTTNVSLLPPALYCLRVRLIDGKIVVRRTVVN